VAAASGLAQYTPLTFDVELAEEHRRRPEYTILYQLVAEHWLAFRDRADAAGSPSRSAGKRS
jgi:hypothetical protein